MLLVSPISAGELLRGFDPMPSDCVPISLANKLKKDMRKKECKENGMHTKEPSKTKNLQQTHLAHLVYKNKQMSF